MFDPGNGTTTPNIQLYKMDISGTIGTLRRGSVRLATNEAPVYIGKAEDNSPVLTIFSKF